MWPWYRTAILGLPSGLGGPLLPFAAQDAHQPHVVAIAVGRAVIFAQAALDLEAGFLVGAAGALVGNVDVEVEAVGVGIGEQPGDRLAQQAAAGARAGIAHGDALQ